MSLATLKLSTVLAVLMLLAASASAAEMFRARGQKNYSEEEEGKLLPTKTFLTTMEIVLLCVLFVVVVFVLVFCVLYFYCFGCVRPPCCTVNDVELDEDESQAQLYREKRIEEIWKSQDK